MKRKGLLRLEREDELILCEYFDENSLPISLYTPSCCGLTRQLEGIIVKKQSGWVQCRKHFILCKL